MGDRWVRREFLRSAGANTRPVVTVIVLLAGILVPYTVAAEPGGHVQVGVNMLSVGNQYTDPQYDDAGLDRLFGLLKAKGFARVSVRVTWSSMERQEGVYNEAYLANLERIFRKLDEHGLKGMLDFHTLFKIESYACPAWVAAYPARDGEPGVYSIIMAARSDAVRRRYLAMQAHVVERLKGCPALDVISVMNEPWPLVGGARGAQDKREIVDTLAESAGLLRGIAPSRKLAVRLTMRFNPWSEDPSKRPDKERLLAAFDVIGLNVYLDPLDDAAREPKTGTRAASWESFRRAVEECRERGREVWVTEFGVEMSGTDKFGEPASEESQRRRCEAWCRRWSDARVPVALAWMLQANPRQEDRHNVYDPVRGALRPAGEALARLAGE